MAGSPQPCGGIDTDVEGQAFAWDHSTDRRAVFSISRTNREVRAFEIPEVQQEP
jgi:hypothetical protein